jgi:hypothetical protein
LDCRHPQAGATSRQPVCRKSGSGFLPNPDRVTNGQNHAELSTLESQHLPVRHL